MKMQWYEIFVESTKKWIYIGLCLQFFVLSADTIIKTRVSDIYRLTNGAVFYVPLHCTHPSHPSGYTAKHHLHAFLRQVLPIFSFSAMFCHLNFCQMLLPQFSPLQYLPYFNFIHIFCHLILFCFYIFCFYRDLQREKSDVPFVRSGFLQATSLHFS